LNFSKASDLYVNTYSLVCPVAPSLKSSISRPPPNAVARGPHMAGCTSCRGSVEQEVVDVKGFRANLHLMQHSESHFPVILGVSLMVGRISNALRPTYARRQCHNMRVAASCQDACPIVLRARRLLWSISMYSVDSGARSRMHSPSP
jgi:hypothetical protein